MIAITPAPASGTGGADWDHTHWLDPLFTLVAAPIVTARDPEVFRKVTRRGGLLDPTALFDYDRELQERVERISTAMLAVAPLPQRASAGRPCSCRSAPPS